MSKAKPSVDSNDDDLSELAQTLNKKFGDGAVMSLGKAPPPEVDVIPSGSRLLDRALGIGGYPRGRLIEVFGPESSGKTTLTLHAIAAVHARGGSAAFIDAEHAFDMQYAKALGVRLEHHARGLADLEPELQELDSSQDHGQRVAQLVSDAGRQASDERAVFGRARPRGVAGSSRSAARGLHAHHDYSSRSVADPGRDVCDDQP